MIRNVFIDLDNTILDFNIAEKIALKKTLSKLGVEPTEYIAKRYSEINLSQWKRLERGEITRAEVKLNRYKILFEEFNIDACPKDATRIYEGFLSQGHYFMVGAQEMITLLFQNYRLYLVSNGTLAVQNGRLDSAKLRSFFDGVYISEEVGANKPDKLFFDRVFDKIEDFKKSESVIIGDSLTSDIKGGINAGIKTIWVNINNEKNSTGIVPDFEVHSLCEVPELIASIE